MKARYFHPFHYTELFPNLKQTKLFVTSEVPVYQVFSDDDANASKDVSDHMRSIMDDLVRPISATARIFTYALCHIHRVYRLIS